MPSGAGGGRKHYNSKAIKASFGYFVAGKIVAATATLIVLFYLVRELSVPEFAAYTSLHALALIIGLLSSVGIPQLLHRYLPELRTQQNSRAMYLMMASGFFFRALSYAVFCGALAIVLEPLASLFKLDAWTGLLLLYLVVGLLRVNATFFAQVLESLLWQRESQAALAIGALCKLVLTLQAVTGPGLDLAAFIQVELISESVTLGLLLSLALWRRQRDPDRSLGDRSVIWRQRSRYFEFASFCYLQNLTSVFHGSAPNRLFVAYFMQPELIAAFGVIDRVIDYFRRYEPLTLFVGLIRPVLVSRYTEHGDFSLVARMGNSILRANLVILGVALALLLVVGETVFTWLSDGKYAGLTALTGVFFVALLVNSALLLLDLLVKAIERNRIFWVSNIFLSASIFLAIPFVASLGLWAVAFSNIVGLLVAISIVKAYLRRSNFEYRFEIRLLLLVLGCILAAAAVGIGARAAGLAPLPSAIATCVAYGLCLWAVAPFRDDERQLVAQLLPARISKWARKSVVEPK